MSVNTFCDKCNEECYWDEYEAKDGRKFNSLRNVDGEEWHFKTCVMNPRNQRGQGNRPFNKPLSKMSDAWSFDALEKRLAVVERSLAAMEARFNAKFPV